MRTKTRVWALAVVLLALSFTVAPAPAQATCQGIGTVVPYAFESITVSSTAIGFTTATAFPAGQAPLMAVVTTETNPIRFRADGSNPTAAEGHLVAASSTIEVCGKAAMTNFKMIRTSADATAKVTFYGLGL